MSVKRKISKAEFEALSDDKKEFYVENKDRRGEYILDLGADEDNPLKSAHDAVKAERDALTTKLADLTAELDTEKARKASKDGSVSKDDHEALKASYETKLAKQAKEHGEVVAKKDGFIKRTLVDSKAMEIASKISKSPTLMARVIKDRLAANLDGDNPQTVVLDNDGKPSAFSLQDLEQELVANPEYAAIVIGSKATGGNAPSHVNGNPGGQGKPALLSQLSPSDLVSHMRATHKDLQG